MLAFTAFLASPLGLSLGKDRRPVSVLDVPLAKQLGCSEQPGC